MAEIKKRKRTILRWNKSAICEILGCELRELDNLLTDETKNKVGYKAGIQYFRDDETFLIIKDFKRLFSHDQIMALIYPKGMI